MLKLFFVSFSCVGLFYFLFAKRRFDFFSLAFFSACIYFMPGYFGFALYPPSPVNGRLKAPLLNETYIVFILVLMAIFFGAIFYDFLFKKNEIKLRLGSSKYVVHVALFLSILGFVLTVFQSGDLLLSANKQQVMSSLGRWHFLFGMASSLAGLIAFVQRRYMVMLVCFFLLCLDVFIGFRVYFAMFVLSLSTVYFSDKGHERFILKNKSSALFLFFMAAILFVYKRIYIAVKIGAWDVVFAHLTSLDTYIKAITLSEPFTTQVILNEIIKSEYVAQSDHFLGLINNLFFFSPFATVSFNSMFQPSLFPGVSFGMANNIWAEMLSSGGWGLLIFFLFMFTIVLFVGSYLLKISDPVIKGGGSLLFTYWAFYIHRNDILYQITLERRVLLIWLLCLFISFFVHLMMRVSNRD